jgi:hypothetical protein
MRRVELEDCTTEVAKEKDARGKLEWKLIRGCWPRGPLDREISGDIRPISAQTQRPTDDRIMRVR